MFEKLNSLDDLLLHEVQDMYHAEKQVGKALPDVAEQAASPELKSALEEHLQQTKVHVNRLERVFEILGQEPKATKCKAMKGILDEGEDTISEKGSSETIDAAIIMSAQKVEHYEIAAYGSLAAWADMLGRQDIKQLFGQLVGHGLARTRARIQQQPANGQRLPAKRIDFNGNLVVRAANAPCFDFQHGLDVLDRFLEYLERIVVGLHLNLVHRAVKDPLGVGALAVIHH